MVYLSHYTQQAVYEPAEGGYWVAETYLVESEQLSVRKAKRNLQELWQECLQENAQSGSEYWTQRLNFRGHSRPFGFNLGFRIHHSDKYIGNDEFYCIERIKGEHEQRYRGYC